MSFFAWAQELPIGQFKEYLPYNKFNSVAQDSENIYAATNQSILVVNKADASFEKWSKLNGLSDIGIQTIYSDDKGRLFIAYSNSNIDIIIDYKVYNIRDIMNKQMTGSKIINSITTFGELAYFSCDFGITIVDLKTRLVKDSWFTIKENESYKVFSFAIHNERYYLATDKGVFSLPVSASNPANFSSWTEEEMTKSPFKLLYSFQNRLFAVRDGGVSGDSLFVYENAQWNHDKSMGISFFRSFDRRGDNLLICSWNHVFIKEPYNPDQRFYWQPSPPNEWQSGVKAIFDEKMNIWVADNRSGLVHIDIKNDTFEIITGEGPASSGAYGLCFFESELAVVPGTRSGPIVPDWSAPEISILKEDSWWYNTDFRQFNRAGGFNSVVINPLNKNEIYVASWLEGLFKINRKTNEMFCYNHSNSILKSSRIKEINSLANDSIVFVSGLVIDKQNNLWMTQTDVLDFIKVKDLNTEEEKWYSFNMSPFLTATKGIHSEHILIDSRNYKWFTIPIMPEKPAQRLVVFFENGSLDNTSLHKKAEVDLTSQVNVTGSRITCITEDRDGNIWTGADQGVKVIFDAASVFNRQVYAKNILLEQNGYVQNLLEFEYVTCITVDAANRKWIGTRSAGVFLLSPNGTQELFHFTTDNSPLFSNQINDIKINPENGEVFFATANGLISYKGTATAGKENYKEALVYPNPVREDYYGPVAVKGLMEDSFCKITSAAGKLIWQGYAYGGQLIWNGKDFNGNRPITGVYFVMASSKTGKEKKVAKFLFIQ